MKTIVLYFFSQSYEDVDFGIVSVNQFPEDATDEDIDFALGIAHHNSYMWKCVPNNIYVPSNKTIYIPDTVSQEKESEIWQHVCLKGRSKKSKFTQ